MDVEAKLTVIKQNPAVFFDSIDQIVRWDATGCDCSTRQIGLKEIQIYYSDARATQWSMRSAQREHTCLIWVSLTGPLFLVDVGVIRTCMRFDGTGVSHVILTIGA
jgi:hypothetical protein